MYQAAYNTEQACAYLGVKDTRYIQWLCARGYLRPCVLPGRKAKVYRREDLEKLPLYVDDVGTSHAETPDSYSGQIQKRTREIREKKQAEKEEAHTPSRAALRHVGR